MLRRSLFLLVAVALAPGASAQEVGSFSNDWTGNDIVIEAIADPKVEGVTCHIAHFERGLIDKLSNASIACRQTGPIVIGDIERDDEGEEVFSERKSLIFKSLAVRRLYDEANQTLIYVVYTRQVQEGSAKMAITSVPLHGAEVTWREP